MWNSGCSPGTLVVLQQSPGRKEEQNKDMRYCGCMWGTAFVPRMGQVAGSQCRVQGAAGTLLGLGRAARKWGEADERWKGEGKDGE